MEIDKQIEKRFYEGLSFIRRHNKRMSGQHNHELLWTFQKLFDLQPQIILEIGSRNGGTLSLWSHSLDKGGTVISIDKLHPRHPGTMLKLRHTITLLKNLGLTAELIEDDSHCEQTKVKLCQLLENRKLDFVFVNGDHSYIGVKKDWEMYNSLVRSGGIFALHDIRSRHKSIQVPKLWEELQDKYNCEVKIIRYGIGIVHI